MSENKKIFATPKVRKFARELGANIAEIEGSERLGRITEEDVKNFVTKNLNKSQTKEDIKVKSEFNHSDFGDIEITDIPRIKRLAASHLSNSWNTIPHVTHHDEVDKEHIVAYSLSVLAKEQLIQSKYAKEAIKKYNIDPNKTIPTKL